MPKLKKIELSKSYTPVDLSFVKVGTLIEFDCFIQRFNGFYLVIEAGTRLSQRDVQILSNTRKHFIKYNDLQAYKKIAPNKEQQQPKVGSLEEIQSEKFETIPLEERLELLYNSLSAILQEYFVQNKRIDFEYFDALLHHYILTTRTNKEASRHIINSMSKEDKHWNHSVNVALLAITLGNFMHYSIVQMKVLGTAALLHDIGKKEISPDIFEKNAKLSNSELYEMRKHPALSADLAKDLGIEDRAVIEAIEHHHEYIDGSGYPDHLRAQRISDFTQIITICDIFDSMTSYRSYRTKKSALNALKAIKSEYNGKIRTKIIDALIKLFHSIYKTEAKN